LLVAYEEEQVLPVASDFDAFLFGSKGVEYPAVPSDQLPFVESLLRHVETILSRPGAETWTQRWLEVVKGQGRKTPAGAGTGGTDSLPPVGIPMPKKVTPGATKMGRRGTISGSMGKKRADGRFGFGDTISTSIIEHMCSRPGNYGAVRHAAECFNYYWPQELDEEYLICWEGYADIKWRYVTPEGLRDFLLERVLEGYAFPLNPKWILCDEGWYKVYEAMEAQGGATRRALDAWWPPSSGLRERMAHIHTNYPHGFTRSRHSYVEIDDGDGVGNDMELAQLQFRRYLALRRAKLKLRVVLFWMKLGREATKRRKALEAAAEAAAEAARALEASAKVLEAAAEAAKSKALAEQAAARTEQSEGRRLAVLEAGEEQVEEAVEEKLGSMADQLTGIPDLGGGPSPGGCRNS